MDFPSESPKEVFKQSLRWFEESHLGRELKDKTFKILSNHVFMDSYHDFTKVYTVYVSFFAQNVLCIRDS